MGGVWRFCCTSEKRDFIDAELILYRFASDLRGICGGFEGDLMAVQVGFGLGVRSGSRDDMYSGRYFLLL